jgi:hypothetical protein
MNGIRRMNSTLEHSYDEVTAEDIAAVEKVLQHIDYQNAKKALLAKLANWLLALRIYKEIEIRFTCMKDRSRIADAHRALLTGIMAVGEAIFAASNALSDHDFKSIQISKQALEVNLKYLRRKYSQWYQPRDPKLMSEVAQAIESAVNA